MSVLPEGDMKASMEMVKKDLPDILKARDSQLFWNNVGDRFIPWAFFSVFIGTPATIAGGLIGTAAGGPAGTIPGAITGAEAGIALAGALSITGPSGSDLERGRIKAATAEQMMVLRNFKSGNVDMITKAILYGGMGGKAGGGAIVGEAIA
jgi:hypothetical protein